MLRCLLVIWIVAVVPLDRALAQAPSVSWPPLSQPGASSFYINGPGPSLDAQWVGGERPDTAIRQIKPTHWKEGGLIGGIVSGVLLGVFAQGMCAYAEGNTLNCGRALIGGVVVGGGMGFALGALIGGQFPKRPRQQ